MLRIIAVGSMLLGLALGFRAFFVWTGCGYDCPAIPVPLLTATGALVVALLAEAIGLGLLVGSALGRPPGGR